MYYYVLPTLMSEIKLLLKTDGMYVENNLTM